MIEVKNLTKCYGNKKVLDDVSFTVKGGEILGFLGPNGAGKSTTMNIITGFLSATDGSVTVNGYDNIENAKECRKAIGYLPEIPPLYNDMTVEEYLSFVCDIKKVKEGKAEHINTILETVKIADVRSRLINNLSKGYKQRVGIAQALVGNPEILILDEPTVGLDPKQILEIRNVIKELGRNRTIILSSHILSEVSAICERVLIINKGKIVAEDTPENLSDKMTGGNKFTVRIAGERDVIETVLADIETIESADELGEKEAGSIDYIISGKGDADIRAELFKALSENNLSLLMIKAVDVSLEDIFLKFTDENALNVEITEETREIEETEEIKDLSEMAEEAIQDDSDI